MKRILYKTKKKQKRGHGRGAEYRPYEKASEFNSIGTCSNIIDWKTGRHMELLSQGELAVFSMLRWDDNVLDIREQFPLNMYKVWQIADHEGIRVSKNLENTMTTDFLVTFRDGTEKAYSVKDSRKVLENMRTVEKLYLEKKYWKQEGVSYEIVFKEEINMILVNNLRLIMEYYDERKVYDVVSLIKHKIATKQILVNIENEILDFSDLTKFIESEEDQ